MDEQMFCRPRGKMVSVQECATACASPSDRPACWLVRGFAKDFADSTLQNDLEDVSLPGSHSPVATGLPGDSTLSGESIKEEGA